MKDQWIEWLQERQRHFFYGIVTILALFFLGSHFLGQKKTGKSLDYIRANLAFQSWVEKKDDLQPLSDILLESPELDVKFGALVASLLVAQEKADLAKPFAERVFERVMNQTPHHAAFAGGSLLIAEGNFKNALSEAVSLKKSLEKNTLLYGFNLMRIATLYRELADRVKEIEALEDLHQYISEDHQAAKQLSDSFSHQNVSLVDYIFNRKSH